MDGGVLSAEFCVGKGDGVDGIKEAFFAGRMGEEEAAEWAVGWDSGRGGPGGEPREALGKNGFQEIGAGIGNAVWNDGDGLGMEPCDLISLAGGKNDAGGDAAKGEAGEFFFKGVEFVFVEFMKSRTVPVEDCPGNKGSEAAEEKPIAPDLAANSGGGNIIEEMGLEEADCPEGAKEDGEEAPAFREGDLTELIEAFGNGCVDVPKLGGGRMIGEVIDQELRHEALAVPRRRRGCEDQNFHG